MKQNFLNFCSRMLLMLALLLPVSVIAQTTITVGSGTLTTRTAPFNNYFNNGTAEMIYPASAFDGPCQIEAVAFQVSTASSLTSPVHIYLGVKTGDSFSSGTDWVAAADLTEVYANASVTLGASTGWENYTFDEPFVYDPNDGNLVVAVSRQSSAYSGSLYYAYTTTTNAVLYKSSDSDASAGAIGAATTQSGSRSDALANAQFTVSPVFVSSCARLAANPVVDSLAVDGGTFTWNAVAGVAQYQYVVMPGAADADWTVATMLADTTLTVRGLNANTPYTLYVRSYCGAGDGEQSAARKVSFRTECDVIDLAAGPFNVGFEEADGFMGNLNAPCFEHGKLTSSAEAHDWLFANASYARSGSAAMGIQDYDEYDYYDYEYYYYPSKAYFAFPQISVPATGVYEVSFYVHGNTQTAVGDSLVVYTNTTPSLAGATRLGKLDETQLPATYERVAFDLPAGVQYVIFAGYTAGDDYAGGLILIDDVVMREKPTCYPGTALHFVSNTANSATFEWTPAGDEAEWEVLYKNDTTSVYTVERVTSPSLTVAGLQHSTAYSYSFILRSVCGGALSPDSTVFKNVKFTSECVLKEAVNDTLLFNGAVSDGLAPCYATSETKAWASSSSYRHGSNPYAYYLTYSATGSYLVMPQADIPENFELSFWVREGYSHYAYDSLKVFINDAPTLEGATLLGELDELSNVYEFHRYNLSAYRGEYYVIFQGWTGSSGYLYLDDVMLTPAPQCMPVTDIKLAGVTSNEATFSWTPGGEEPLWTFALAEIGEDDVFDDPVYTIDTLQPATTYEFTVQVKSLCNDGSEGEWAEKTFSFTTPCEAIAALPWSEDFEDMTASAVAPCWNNEGSKSSTISSSPAIVWGVYSYSGNKMLYMKNYSVQSGHTEVLSPTFVLPEDQVYIFKFDYSHRASCGDMKVKISADGGVTFTELGSFASTGTNDYTIPGTFQTVEFPLTAYAGKTVVFQFSATSNYGSGAIYLDNVRLEEAPSCMKPSDIDVVNVGLDSAVLVWQGTAPQYELILSEGTKVDTVIVSDTCYVIGNLQSAHKYSYMAMLRGICSATDSSEWAMSPLLSFTTDCEIVSTFPWTEDFEAYSGSTSANDITCWSTEWVAGYQQATKSPWAVSTSYPAHGTKSIAATYAGSSAVSLAQLVLPVMNIPEANAYEFIFAARRENSTSYKTDEVRVFVNSQPDTIGATRLLAVHRCMGEAPAVEEDGYVKYAVTLPNAGEQYIVLQYYSKDGLGMYFDDFEVREIPSCAEVTNIHMVENSITTTSVDFAWDGDAPQYQVSLGTQKAILNGPAMHMSGLIPAKSYVAHIQVRAICAPGDTSAWSDVKDFRFATECETLELPYENSFDDYDTGVLDAPCWTNVHVSGTGSSRFSITTSGRDGSKALTLPDMTNHTITRLTTPDFQMNEGVAYELTMDVNRNTSGSSYTSEGVRLYVVSQTGVEVELGFLYRNCNQTDGGSVVAETATGWYTYTFAVPDTIHGVIHFILQGENQYGSSTYMDNVKVREVPTCFPGSNLRVLADSTTQTSAAFAWTPNAEDNLNAHVVVKNGNDTIADVVVADTIFCLTNLTPSTAYKLNVQVYTICGETESLDALSATLSLATACGPIAALPWLETFEGHALGSSTSAAPLCWNTINANAGTFPYVYVNNSSTYVYGGSQSLYFVSSDSKYAYAVLPEFAAPMNDLQVSFWYKDESATSSGYLHLGYMTDPTDATTFVPLTEFPRSASFVKAKASTAAIPAELAGTARLAFRYGGANSNYYMGLDSLLVQAAPLCDVPQNLAVSNITSNSAKLTWGAGGKETSWTLIVKNGADTVVNEVVSGTPEYVLSGLNANADYAYTVLVLACGEEANKLTKAVSFHTLCEALEASELPYVMDFEAVTTGSSVYNLPECWAAVKYSNYPYVIANSTYTTYAHQGTKALYLNGSNTLHVAAVLPAMEADLNDLLISFWYKQSSVSDGYGSLVVGAMSDPADYSTFVPVEVLARLSDYTRAEIYLHDIPADHHYLALSISGGTYSTSIYVDEVTVAAQPNCKSVVNLDLFAVTENDATFTWNALGEESEWIVELFNASSERVDSVAVAAPAYVLNSLTANTKYTYTVSVKASCGEGEMSDAVVKTFNFRTPVPADAVAVLSAADSLFVADFSSADEQAKWVMDGAGNNQFVFGADEAALLSEATAALYVSNNASAYTYTNSSYSASVAYRQLQLPAADSVLVEFDWKSTGGESTWDFGRAFFAPADLSVEVTGASPVAKIAGSQVTQSTGSSLTPAGATDLANGKMNLTATAQHAAVVLEDVAAGNYNLIFVWGNDGSGGTANYPLAVCNLKVALLGVMPVGPSTGFENLDLDAEQPIKFIRDGHVYILNKGIIYNVTGQRVEIVK